MKSVLIFIKKSLFYISTLLRFFRALYLVFFRKKSFCEKKLARYVHGFIKLDQCRLHVCQYQACNKQKESCPCGRIKNAQLLEV